MEEIWKDIKDYEGYYQVSNLGGVRSLGRWVANKGDSKKFIKGRMMKPYKGRFGYFMVGLCKEGILKQFLIHRLVAETFIPNPKNYNVVNHKDEDKTNNHVENLEWCTYGYNNNYGSRNYDDRRVYQFTLTGEYVNTWGSAMQVEKVLNYNHQYIIWCCTGLYESSYNYIWRFTPPSYNEIIAGWIIDVCEGNPDAEHFFNSFFVSFRDFLINNYPVSPEKVDHDFSVIQQIDNTLHGHTSYSEYSEVIFKLINRVCKGQWFDENKMLEYVTENYNVSAEMVKHDFTLLCQLRNTLHTN